MERSFLAGAAEPVIRFRASKKKFTDPDACTAYITAMAKAQKVRYVLPKAAALTGRITEGVSDGMQYFTVVSHGEKEKREEQTAPVDILYLHGGSYFAPPHIFHWDMLLRLSELCGARIFVPLYPRAPLRTCSTAYRELEDFCGRVKPDVLMGDSAGGGLAMGLAITLGSKVPKRVIALSPWLDVTLTNPEIAKYEPLDVMLGSYGLRRMGKLWAGSLDVNDPRVSPINGDLTEIEDLTMLAGTHEIFYPDVIKLSRMLEGHKKPHRLIIGEGMSHVWPCYPMKEGRETLVKIAEIIKLY